MELRPMNSYTLPELVSLIQTKYGSIRRFNMIAGRPDHDIYYLKKFNPQDPTLKRIKQGIYDDMVKHWDVATTLTKKDVSLMQLVIADKFGTIRNFCRKYPDFNPYYVSRVFNGKFKRITKKVKSLIQVLDIKE